MKHSGWNPTKRNRNIGTEKSGYSKNNKFVVPEKWRDFKVFWERLTNPIIIPIIINNHQITMLVEPTNVGYIHASTPHDIIQVLELIPQEHLIEIEIVVLRQPKKKEEILRPVWGRFIYYADLGKYSGAGVYLEAVEASKVIKWTDKLSPFETKELKALENDGHRIEKVKRGYDIHTTPESVRKTQLFRTLPHEIGHAVDYLYNSVKPSAKANSDTELDYITNTFYSKTSLDKEEFANRYAREFYLKYSATGQLPFEQLFNKEALTKLGLNLNWFRIETNSNI
jgi:hypothetical protein